MPREFKYEVLDRFATLSSTESATGNVYSKELNLISYNDGNGVYDIRNWTTATDDTRRMGKGITLNLEELKALRDALNELEDLND